MVVVECFIHNFIRVHDPNDIDTNFAEYNPTYTPEVNPNELHEIGTTQEETSAAGVLRTKIGKAMWLKYRQQGGGGVA